MILMMSRTTKLRTMATAIFNPMDRRAIFLPTSFQMIATVERQGMKKLINHLVNLHGCRRIAFIRGPENNFSADKRYRDYKEVLKENDIKLDPALVTPTLDWDDGHIGINILIDEHTFNNLSHHITKATVIDLQVEGKSYEVLIKDYEKDYIKDQFVHIDFYELKKGKPAHFNIPFNLVGNSSKLFIS